MFTCPWDTYAYRVLHFGLCNSPPTFQRAILAIFAALVNDYVEVYMDDFTVYESTYDEALQNLDRVLEVCEENQLSLSHEKCLIMVEQGIVLGHHISSEGIKVNPKKIEVIQKLTVPQTQTDVRSFLGHAEYYRRFIESFSKIETPMFSLL